MENRCDWLRSGVGVPAILLVSTIHGLRCATPMVNKEISVCISDFLLLTTRPSHHIVPDFALLKILGGLWAQ
jgi:hypothetical protein